MRRSFLRFVVCITSLAAVQAVGRRTSSLSTANPIRKVVNLLTEMQKKVKAEGEREEKLYEKFMCYCSNGEKELSKEIEDANTKVPSLESDIKKSVEQKKQTEEALKKAQTDRSEAKATMEKATAIREKEAAAYAKEKDEATKNIEAMGKAITALENGMGGAFLQTQAATVIKKLATEKQDTMEDEDHQDLMSFLEGEQGSDYAPQSGQITGILKQMNDEMTKNLNDATKTENDAIATYDELMIAKKKEITVLTAGIETKMEKVGELGVKLVQMKGDLSDTAEALEADKEFLANLAKNCEKKQKEWEIRQKTRAEELLALADTIKMLNDDDALELFKKTLPSAASSFLEVRVTAAASRRLALAQLKKISSMNSPQRVRLDFLALALTGKKIGFEKIIGMIDEMISTLKTEQEDDDKKKEYCVKQFDIADDKKKGLERTVANKQAAIDTAKEGIATLKEEIEDLKAGIVELDKEVAEATEQRKEENEEYKELMSSDTAAKELLGFAKNRLNKFYNPKMYKPPAKKELSAEDRIATNMGGAAFVQISAHSQLKEAPPPPPETFGAYSKKSEENAGVMAMIDLLIKDLDKEMTEAETEEKNAQEDYETLMKDSAEKRTKDSKSLTQKESTKAELEADLEDHIDAKAEASQELASTLKYIESLHADCDWLLKYFDIRKEARTSEIDALGKAKAVLNGADYSLLQKGDYRSSHLRGGK
mmetsp:Transcript_92483/g.299218  ORF Transcript_92483/g.299218 Transcript_92483/m.299218 type:complete len:713 (+) Transcript_92483:84-2222(+)